MKRPRIGVALGGGAARGLAHLGVLKVLFASELKPAIVVGTSIGALIGALFVAHPHGETVIAKVTQYFLSDSFKKIKFDFLRIFEGEAEPEGLFDALTRYLKKSLFYNFSLTRQSFVSPEDYMENIAYLVSDIRIESAPIRFAAIATDLFRGTEVILSEGSLRQAVAASSAIPGIFPPVSLNGTLLVDGGWVNQLPASACRALGSDFVVGVDVVQELEPVFQLHTGLDILRRANAVTRHTLNRMRRNDADFIIAPHVGDVSWAQFECVNECIRRGEEAARRSLPALQATLAERSSRFSRILRKFH